MVNKVYATAAAAAAVRWELGRRQADVLALVVRGCPNKLIARTLGCAENTVEYHVTELLRKARVRSRTELISQVLAEEVRRRS
jgi:DNA-binding NarL/FixJ family response regulator